jgi:hypothetical protein
MSEPESTTTCAERERALAALIGRTKQLDALHAGYWRAAATAHEHAEREHPGSLNHRRMGAHARRVAARREWVRALVAHVAEVASMLVLVGNDATFDADERARVLLVLDAELAEAGDSIVRVCEVIL